MEQDRIRFWHSDLIRVCEWVKIADQKCFFVSSFYLAILGYIVSKSRSIIMAHHAWYFWVLSTLLIIVFCAGLFFLFKTIFPRLKNTRTENSYFYFGHVANMGSNDFIKNSKNIENNKVLEQILEQIHTNSQIIQIKMLNIQTSIKLLFLALPLSALFIFIIS